MQILFATRFYRIDIFSQCKIAFKILNKHYSMTGIRNNLMFMSGMMMREFQHQQRFYTF